MSLEKAIEENTAALNSLTAALAGKTAAVTGTAGAATAGAKTDKPPKQTIEDVTAAAAKVKVAMSADAAKFLIKTVGKAEKMLQIKPPQFAAFIAACEKAVESGEIEGFPEGGGDEDM
jgi:hypothetical protein